MLTKKKNYIKIINVFTCFVITGSTVWFSALDKHFQCLMCTSDVCI